MEDVTEKPISFASRSLTSSERNYLQIEQDALSIMFGFHSYLYGRKFTLVTDQQALVSIFDPKTVVPPLSAARMQRWSLILAAYQYEIEYPSSAEHANADALSRLVSSSADDRLDVDEYLICYVNEFPVTARDIASATGKHPVLARVSDSTLHVSSSVVADHVLQRYFLRKHELSFDQGCVLWGLRVVIPEAYRVCLLDDLNQEHCHICQMKFLAQGYFWWPRTGFGNWRACKCMLCLCGNGEVSPLGTFTPAERRTHRFFLEGQVEIPDSQKLLHTT